MKKLEALSNTLRNLKAKTCEKQDSLLNKLSCWIRRQSKNVLSFPSKIISENLQSLARDVFMSPWHWKKFSPAVAALMMWLALAAPTKTLHADTSPNIDNLSIAQLYDWRNANSPAQFKWILDDSFKNEITINTWELNPELNPKNQNIIIGLSHIEALAKRTNWYVFKHSPSFDKITQNIRSNDSFKFKNWDIILNRTWEVALTYKKEKAEVKTRSISTNTPIVKQHKSKTWENWNVQITTHWSTTLQSPLTISNNLSNVYVTNTQANTAEKISNLIQELENYWFSDTQIDFVNSVSESDIATFEFWKLNKESMWLPVNDWDAPIFYKEWTPVIKIKEWNTYTVIWQDWIKRIIDTRNIDIITTTKISQAKWKAPSLAQSPESTEIIIEWIWKTETQLEQMWLKIVQIDFIKKATPEERKKMKIWSFTANSVNDFNYYNILTFTTSWERWSQKADKSFWKVVFTWVVNSDMEMQEALSQTWETLVPLEPWLLDIYNFNNKKIVNPFISPEQGKITECTTDYNEIFKTIRDDKKIQKKMCKMAISIPDFKTRFLELKKEKNEKVKAKLSKKYWADIYKIYQFSEVAGMDPKKASSNFSYLLIEEKYNSKRLDFLNGKKVANLDLDELLSLYKKIKLEDDQVIEKILSNKRISDADKRKYSISPVKRFVSKEWQNTSPWWFDITLWNDELWNRSFNASLFSSESSDAQDETIERLEIEDPEKWQLKSPSRSVIWIWENDRFESWDVVLITEEWEWFIKAIYKDGIEYKFSTLENTINNECDNNKINSIQRENAKEFWLTNYVCLKSKNSENIIWTFEGEFETWSIVIAMPNQDTQKPVMYWIAKDWLIYRFDKSELKKVIFSWMDWKLSTQTSYSQTGDLKDWNLNFSADYLKKLGGWTTGIIGMQVFNGNPSLSSSAQRTLFKENQETVKTLSEEEQKILTNQVGGLNIKNGKLIWKQSIPEVVASVWWHIKQIDSATKFWPNIKLSTSTSWKYLSTNLEAWIWPNWIIANASAYLRKSLPWVDISSYSIYWNWAMFSSILNFSWNDIWRNPAIWAQVTHNPVFLSLNSMASLNMWYCDNSQDWTQTCNLYWLFQLMETYNDQICWGENQIKLTSLLTWTFSTSFKNAWTKVTVWGFEHMWDEVWQCENWDFQTRIYPKEDRENKIELIIITEILKNIGIQIRYTPQYVKNASVKSSEGLKNLKNLYEKMFEKSFETFKNEYFAIEGEKTELKNHLLWKYFSNQEKDLNARNLISWFIQSLNAEDSTSNLDQSINAFLAKELNIHEENQHTISLKFMIKEFLFRYTSENWKNISNIIIDDDLYTEAYWNADYIKRTWELFLSPWLEKFPDIRSMTSDNSLTQQLTKVLDEPNKTFIEKTGIIFDIGIQDKEDWNENFIWDLSPAQQNWINNFVSVIRFLAENKVELDSQWKIFTVNRMLSRVVTNEQDILTLKRIFSYLWLFYDGNDMTASWWIYLSPELLEKFDKMPSPFNFTDDKIKELLEDLETQCDDWSKDKFLKMELSDYMHMWSWLERYLIWRWLEFNNENRRKIYIETNEYFLNLLKKYQMYWIDGIIATNIWDDDESNHGYFDLDRSSNKMYADLDKLLSAKDKTNEMRRVNWEILVTLKDIQSEKADWFEKSTDISIDDLLDQWKSFEDLSVDFFDFWAMSQEEKEKLDQYIKYIETEQESEWNIYLDAILKKWEYLQKFLTESESSESEESQYNNILAKSSVKQYLYAKHISSLPKIKELIETYEENKKEIKEIEEGIVSNFDSESKRSTQHAAIYDIINTVKDQFENNQIILKWWKGFLAKYNKIDWEQYSWQSVSDKFRIDPKSLDIIVTGENWKEESFKIFNLDWSEWKDFEIFNQKHLSKMFGLKTNVDFKTDSIMLWIWFKARNDKGFRE